MTPESCHLLDLFLVKTNLSVGFCGTSPALMHSNRDLNVKITRDHNGNICMTWNNVHPGTLCCALQRIKSNKAKFWAVKQTCCSVFTHVAPADALRCRPCLVRGQAQRLRRNVYSCWLVHGSDWLSVPSNSFCLLTVTPSVRVFCIIDWIFRTSPALEGKKALLFVCLTVGHKRRS